MSINESMTLLADAIREKSGASGKLSLAAMTEAVNGITLNTGGDIDFTGVNVTANDLLSGVVAVNASGVKVTGNIETVTATKSGDVITVPKGYIAEQQTFDAGVILPTVSVTEDKMLSGVTAINSAGETITGTIPTVTASLDGSTVTVPVGFIAQQQTFTVTLTYPETNFTALDLKTGATALDGTGTLIDGAMPQATLTPELSFIEESGYYEFHCKVTESGYVEKGSSVGEVSQSVPKARIEDVSRNSNLDFLDTYTYLVNMTTGYVVETDYLSFNLDKLSYTVSGLTVELGYECMCMGETITVELPQVSFTAEDLKPGVTAINTEGEVVEGNMPYAGVAENDNQIIIQSGYVPEKLTFNKSGGSFVKVTEFIAPHDAYTAVTAINVTGWGLLNNEMEGYDEDFSKYNGVYEVTPDTANEQELTDRVFKHPTEKMYIFFGQEMENGEGDCWFFASDRDYLSAYSALAYKNGKELPNGQFTWYKTYSDSPVLTTTHVTTDVPAQPLVLSGASAKFENGEWVIGSAVTLSGYEKEPITEGIYMVSENKLVGEAIAFDFLKWMPTDGLLMYFPMFKDGVDRVNGIRTVVDKGILFNENGACNTRRNSGMNGMNTSFEFPKQFTMSAKVKVNSADFTSAYATIFDFGAVEDYQGVGIIVDTDNFKVGKIGYHYNGMHSPYHDRWGFEVSAGVSYIATLTYDGTYLRIYKDGVALDGKAEIEFTPSPRICFFTDHSQPGFSGEISEVMLWNRVLTADEIATLVR